MSDSTESATPPESTKSPNSNCLVNIQIRPHFQANLYHEIPRNLRFLTGEFRGGSIVGGICHTLLLLNVHYIIITQCTSHYQSILNNYTTYNTVLLLNVHYIINQYFITRRPQYVITQRQIYDGVATVSRIDKFLGLFCRISSLL